jgi:hypothetical protein
MLGIDPSSYLAMHRVEHEALVAAARTQRPTGLVRAVGATIRTLPRAAKGAVRAAKRTAAQVEISVASDARAPGAVL